MVGKIERERKIFNNLEMDDLGIVDQVTRFGHQHQAQAGVHLLVDLTKILKFKLVLVFVLMINVFCCCEAL